MNEGKDLPVPVKVILWNNAYKDNQMFQSQWVTARPFPGYIIAK